MATPRLCMSIREIASSLQNGVLSSSDLLSFCIRQIKATKSLNVFITVTEKEAEDLAIQSDVRIKNGSTKGLLDGIPVAFKDNFNTKGTRTSCGSHMLANYYPTYNATVVQKLLNEGAIMMGKTNMDEFAMGSGTVDSIYGPTKNPWRSELKYKLWHRSKHGHQASSLMEKEQITTFTDKDWFIAGGSSGGSAVAVAVGSCFAALGSDTGGSTRNPAAQCGIIGLKPTYGLLSRYGLIPLVNSMDVPGILTKTVDDAGLLLNVLAGHDPKDSTTVLDPFCPVNISEEPNISGVHVAVPEEYYCPGMSSEIVETWKEIADLLERGGAKVTNVSMPHTQYSISCYSVLNCCEVASNFARYDGIEYGHRATNESSTESLYATTRHEGFNEVVRGRILAGNYFLLRRNYDKYFQKALKVRRLIHNDFLRVFEKGVNVILTPVTLTDSPPYSLWKLKDNRQQSSIEDYCTQPANMAGVPAVSFPCKLSSQQLPISLQLMAPCFQEQTLLTVVKWIEQRLDFPLLDLQL
ncbi:glutamyl-tRNA(Gln) amidotransferase subunit A, mitochondrial isoform X1 [Tachypleus tridentatus]|uniref:glutamyl-tRNA(Gln) amidotransferase subunit A, mitochondrial isoform X1 n=2 Tax=Tachypleus tridentatus TaxID=6853 RepID=UPI003FD649AD